MCARKVKSELGATMVEMAIGITLFIFLIAAVLDFSWVIYRKIIFDLSARHGVHIAAMTKDDPCTIRETAAVTAANKWVESFSFLERASVSWTTESDPTTGIIELSGDAPMGCYFICQLWISAGSQMHSTAAGRYEYGACTT